MNWNSENIISSEDFFQRKNFPILKAGQLHVWSVSLDSNEEFIRNCKKFLSVPEIGRTDWFNFEDVKNNYIISQGILRFLISGYLNIDISEIQMQKHAKGKPYVSNDLALYFNISNSGKKCVFCFSRDSEVGIDLEMIRPLPDLEQMIEKNFTKKEVAYISKIENEKLNRFFLFWTIKESYLKAIGEGMRLAPDHLEFSIEEEIIKFIGAKGFDDPISWLFKKFELKHNHIGTIVYQKENSEMHLLTVN